jgi:glycerol-3-phosphate dehydrogenase (NAD(P)+)
MNTTQKIAILGAGSWGTAVAIHTSAAGFETLLWSHEADHVARMRESRINDDFLPGIHFPPRLEPTENLQSAVTKADIVLIAVPSHAFKSVLNQLPKPKNGLAWLTKGLCPDTQRFLSDLVIDKWGQDFPIAAISGPSFAKEVARNMPTAICVASPFANFQMTLRDVLHQNNLRVYLSDDLHGVEICGAVKNVLAIACGISDGLGYGANAKAAIITRGLAEMTRLGLKVGANQETFLGLAGVGDLVLTCTDNQSRNRRFGLLLGQNIDANEAFKQIGQVVEGSYNAAQVCALAKRLGVDMPLCQEVLHVLEGRHKPEQTVINLLGRPPNEMWG